MQHLSEKTKLVLLAIALLLALCFCGWADMEQHPSSKHVCIDSTHATCDGECECDGLGCD